MRWIASQRFLKKALRWEKFSKTSHILPATRSLVLHTSTDRQQKCQLLQSPIFDNV
jgi:hypothetical protein